MKCLAHNEKTKNERWVQDSNIYLCGKKIKCFQSFSIHWIGSSNLERNPKDLSIFKRFQIFFVSNWSKVYYHSPGIRHPKYLSVSWTFQWKTIRSRYKTWQNHENQWKYRVEAHEQTQSSESVPIRSNMDKALTSRGLYQGIGHVPLCDHNFWTVWNFPYRKRQ